MASRYRAQGFWRDETIAQRFTRVAERAPDKLAIVDGARRISYGQALRSVENISQNLLNLGVPRGGVVALQSANCAEFLLMHLAAQRIGRLFLPLHDSWRHAEIKHLLTRTQAGVLVVPGVYRDFDYAAMALELRAHLPELHHIYRLEGASPGIANFEELTRPVSIDAAGLALETPDADSPAAIMLSGGTTAMSKMSRYSSNNFINMLNYFAVAVNLTADDVAAALAPCGTGATGYIYPMITPLFHGATSVILPRWRDPEEAIELIIRESCTYAVGIPTQLTRMIPGLEKRAVEEFSAFRVFSNAGAPLPLQTARRIEALMGCRIQSVYGATDGGTPTLTYVSDPEEKRLTTVGRVVPGYECDLRDSHGDRVAPGESGEIYWRGPDKSWGYLNDDEATALAFTADHFYKSGDLGSFDADGYLKISGRVRDMILRGGRNISPQTVEEQLIRHPSVLEVAVAAMPDAELGERACAFVVLKPDKTLTFAEAVEFLKGCQLAIWQLPERLEIVEDLPRSTGGKVAKAQLTLLVTQKMRAAQAHRHHVEPGQCSHPNLRFMTVPHGTGTDKP
jgi:non-ribosomal peptide synthetase component E (peptide arylation enzyme)